MSSKKKQPALPPVTTTPSLTLPPLDDPPPPKNLTRFALSHWLLSHGFALHPRMVPDTSTGNKSGYHSAFVWMSPSGRWEVYVPDEPEQTKTLTLHFGSLPISEHPLVVSPRLVLVDMLDAFGNPASASHMHDTPTPTVYSSITVLDQDSLPWVLFMGEDPPYRIEDGLAEEKLERAWKSVKTHPHRKAQLAEAEVELCTIRREMLAVEADRKREDEARNEDPNA